MLVDGPLIPLIGGALRAFQQLEPGKDLAGMLEQGCQEIELNGVNSIGFPSTLAVC